MFSSVFMEQPTQTSSFIWSSRKWLQEHKKILLTVYENKTLTVWERLKRLRNWCEDLEIDQRSGWPSAAWKPETGAIVHGLWPETTKWPVNWWRMNLSWTGDDSLWDCAWWFGKEEDVCELCSAHPYSWAEVIQTCQSNPHFLNCVITTDKSWVFSKGVEQDSTGGSESRPKQICLKI